MRVVDRYGLEVDEYNEPAMYRQQLGEYVSYTDYKKLEERNAQLKSRIAELEESKIDAQDLYD